MLVTAILLCVSLVAGGGAMLWIAGASVRGTLTRNGIAGVRTTATLASDEAWAAAQTAAAGPTRLGGVLAVVTGFAALAVGIADPAADVALAVVALAGTGLVLASVLVGAARGNRAANVVGESAEDVST
ncbi:SdpI family protein [Serinibacter salmoneus]|uniref:SdpI/YhfL family protein n=1 Tax=Serinibacter salmoneus TaxID=556530 RepID=A0A2A9D3U1_9MICO|nr:SdpI family protein [Serinibacter salmoneus]PFG20925.1 SdpI/YhfL family protein [Serinibacter salmoneus]